MNARGVAVTEEEVVHIVPTILVVENGAPGHHLTSDLVLTHKNPHHQYNQCIDREQWEWSRRLIDVTDVTNEKIFPFSYRIDMHIGKLLLSDLNIYHSSPLDTIQ